MEKLRPAPAPGSREDVGFAFRNEPPEAIPSDRTLAIEGKRPMSATARKFLISFKKPNLARGFVRRRLTAAWNHRLISCSK
jgi:hypothetical protein